ncbi:cupin domain-containing protein [Crocinitomicaceae bacterium]|nr:cupin domain-containing protein [Crocinitomicaceae bacterium]
MKSLIAFLFVTSSFVTIGQTIKSLKKYKPIDEFENIHVQMICEDEHQSSFIIWVKNHVQEHYHSQHTENIVVLSGKGLMTLGDRVFTISKGDFINIPKGTKHSVKKVHSHSPLKVLSVQTPLWDPKDRTITE